MPIKDRPRRDIDSNTEWPDIKEPQARLVSIPIGSGPDVDDDEDPDEDALASQDRAVERWLNGAVRGRH